MEFRVLGPLQISAGDGRPCPVAPFQARVLAVLLLAANDAVALPRLVDAVWDRDPPATAKRQIQNAVSALRRQLAAAGIPGQLITADRTGYRIQVDAQRFDAHRFRDLVAQAEAQAADGRTAQAADRLAEALALWRGPALAGVGGRVVAAGAARLHEQRLAAIELRVGLQLDLGRHRDVVGELAELVAAYPLREPLVGLLMRALHATGRRADALAAYHGIRARLAEDLGIDPGTELRGLYTQLLRDHDDPPAAPARPGPRRVPRQLPTGTRTFVGRTAELAELTRLLHETDGADTGAATIMAISGTAGVGKTALAIHWAHQVAARFPDGQLYVNLRGYDPAAAPTDPATAIRRFLDALGVPPHRIPADAEAQITLYRTVIADRRILVVLDNARDTAHVRPLLPGTGSCHVVVTSRRQLSGLVAAEGAQLLTLDLLATGEAGDLLARHLGRPRLEADPQATDDIVTSCGRLPLALAIVAARAAAAPALPLASLAAELADTHRRLDALDAGDPTTQARAVFSWSYQQLDPPAARLFRLLSLHPGPDISAPAAASLAGLGRPRVRPLLAELVHAHLLLEPAPGRYSLHDLLRAYVAEQAHTTDPEDERRAAIHRVLDHYLHTACDAVLLLNPHRDPITIDPPQPGTTPEHPADHKQALDWFAVEKPVLLAALDHAGDTHTWQLAWTLWTFLDLRGHWDDQITAQHAALAAARRLANPAEESRAHRLLATAYAQMGRTDEAHAHAGASLDIHRRTGDQVGQAHAHLDLARIVARQGHHRLALTHAEQALHRYLAAAHQAGQANCLNNIGWYHAQLGDHHQALHYCQQAVGLHQDLGNRLGQAYAWDSLGYAHHHLGHHAEAAACYRHALDLYRHIGDRYNEAETLTRLGDTHHAANDTTAARNAWQTALTILDDLDHPDADQLRAKLTVIA